jgi:hypothetical protein
MTDQNLDSELEQVAPEISEQNELEQDNQGYDEEAVKKAAKKDHDFQAMRQRQKEMEWQLKQKDELIERFLAQKPESKQTIAEEPEDPDEDYIPKGKVKQLAHKALQPLEKKVMELEAKLAQQEQNKLLSSIPSKFPDFNDIVNNETLELLEKNEPELAATISQLKDPYQMAITSYKYIKALNLVDKVPNARRVREVEKKLDRNGKTIQSPMAFDKRPMAQAFKSTEADKNRLYEEMMGYASQANGL